MHKSVLAIRHIEFEDLGFFEAPLLHAGCEVRYFDAGKDNFRALDPRGPSLIVVLGGPMGAYEEKRYPFLSDEIGFIEDRVAADKPILGVCLGSQLIARSMGARVYPGVAKEIGFAPIRLTPSGRQSPLAAIPREQPVLHWHGDAFDLPEGAELLASTDAYANQAFSAGPNVLALQFHLEAGRGIERWISGHAEELRTAGIDPRIIRVGAERHAASLEAASSQALTTWLSKADI